MLHFIKDNRSVIVKMIVNQIGMIFFGLMLSMATNQNNSLFLAASIFSVLFYMFLEYTVGWDLGAHDKIKLDGGRIEYQPYKGEITRRLNGSMIALETGTAYAYSIDKLQDRGKFFIDPGEEVYAGQVVGEHVHDNDLVINVTKAKQLTNVRASGSDEKARVIPKVVMSLEECLEYIKGDELVEVTPKSMRMRKIILDHLSRKRSNKD